MTEFRKKGGAERKGVHMHFGSPLFNPVEYVFIDTLIYFYAAADSKR